MAVENDLRNRISESKVKFSWSENSLSNGDKATQRRLNRQLSHDAAITSDTLILILEQCKELSAEWLMRGEGEMLRSAKVSADGEAEKLRMENQMLRDEIIQLHIQLAQLRAKPQKMAAG